MHLKKKYRFSLVCNVLLEFPLIFRQENFIRDRVLMLIQSRVVNQFPMISLDRLSPKTPS